MKDAVDDAFVTQLFILIFSVHRLLFYSGEILLADADSLKKLTPTSLTIFNEKLTSLFQFSVWKVGKREAQKTWSTPVLDKLQLDIEQSLDQTQSKRFSLTQGRYAGAWLIAIPMSPLGLKLTDGQVRCAVAFRLSAKICAAHTC